MYELNSSVVTSNMFPPGPPPFAFWDSTDLIPVLVLSLCFLLGVPGNIAVIILRPNWQHLSSLSQSLMLNLAISDLLCLLTLPLWIYSFLYSWTLGLVTFELLLYLVHCSIYGSLLTLMALSVQRYLQVVQLQKCFDRVGKKRILGLLWLIAMILSIPSLVVRQLTSDQQWTICAVLLSETLLGIVSMSVVVFSYISLHRKVNQAAVFNNPQTTRLITSIIVTFFVLWMPYHITSVLAVTAIWLQNDSLWKSCIDSFNIVTALVFVNSFMIHSFLHLLLETCALCAKKMNMDNSVNAEARRSRKSHHIIDEKPPNTSDASDLMMIRETRESFILYS